MYALQHTLTARVHSSHSCNTNHPLHSICATILGHTQTCVLPSCAAPAPPCPPGWSEQIPVLARVVAVKDACLPGKAGLLQLALQRYQVRLGPWWLGWPVCVSGVCALPLGWCHAWAESGTKDIVGGFAHLASPHNHLPPCQAACRTVPHHEVACCCGTCKPILWSCHTPLRATSTAGEQ